MILLGDSSRREVNCVRDTSTAFRFTMATRAQCRHYKSDKGREHAEIMCVCVCVCVCENQEKMYVLVCHWVERSACVLLRTP